MVTNKFMSHPPNHLRFPRTPPQSPYFLANGSQHAYDQVNADGATILRAEIQSLLDERLKVAEAQFLASPVVKSWQAKQEHLFMVHGTMERCQCPEWKDKAPFE